MELGPALAFASLAATLKTMEVLARRGLISPHDAEEIYSALVQAIEDSGHERLRHSLTSRLDPQMVAILQLARDNWRDPA